MQAITLGAIGVAAAAEFYDRSTDKVQILCHSFAVLEPAAVLLLLNVNLLADYDAALPCTVYVCTP